MNINNKKMRTTHFPNNLHQVLSDIVKRLVNYVVSYDV